MSEDAPAAAPEPKDPDPTDIHLGKRLRRRRRLLGLTQQVLAEKVGIRFQQIQKYECGANKISAARLHALAGALEVTPNYFYEGLNGNFNVQASAVGMGELSHEEIDLVQAFRRASPKARHAFLDVLGVTPSPDE